MTDEVSTTADDVGPAPDVPVLAAPRDGVPDIIDTAEGLEQLARSMAAGTGPVAVDTERAQGFRYTGRAYLLQFRREGAGTALLDPIPLMPEPGLAALQVALDDAEWIIHAATQDLPCLVDAGLLPHRLFDTELAARLLGYPRVALGTLAEQLLGVRLLKEHSAADWSVRPLPTDWLSYAALDVELLMELRDILSEQLRAAGKDEWARQEFAYLLGQAALPIIPRVDPWRRTSGLHGVRSSRGLSIVRELWTTRDELARSLDKAPGRILGDEAIAAVATGIKEGSPVPDGRALQSIPRFNRREAKRYRQTWLDSIQRAMELPIKQLPPMYLAADGPPPPRTWASRDPQASKRWEAVRPVLTDLAEQLELPIENLIPPDPLRRLLWTPSGTDEASVRTQLSDLGVRAWQVDIVAPPIAASLAEL
jgi:ribonuclease D